MGDEIAAGQTWLRRRGFVGWEDELRSGWFPTDEPVSAECLGWVRVRIWAVVDAPTIGRIVWWSKRTIYPDDTEREREGPRKITRPAAVRRYLRQSKMILHTGVDPSRVADDDT